MSEYAPRLTDPPAPAKKVLLQINRQFTTLIGTSFGVVAALSWNEAIKSMFARGGVFGAVGSHGVWYTAVVTTVVAFLVTAFISSTDPDAPSSSSSSPKQKLLRDK